MIIKKEKKVDICAVILNVNDRTLTYLDKKNLENLKYSCAGNVVYHNNCISIVGSNNEL